VLVLVLLLVLLLVLVPLFPRVPEPRIEHEHEP
jgi:hypothetical protein